MNIFDVVGENFFKPLSSQIETEFNNRSIGADVRVFADLLEIIKPEWQNAVEGYLNTQRFNIIVDPSTMISLLKCTIA